MATLTSPPSPPFIDVEGIPNFRDLGGYVTTSENYPIRSGIIYRSGEPSMVTEKGISTMDRHGIRTFYDLRSTIEITKLNAAGKRGVVEWEGCKRLYVPVFTDQNYSPESLAIRFKDYASDGTEGFTRAYKQILDNGPPSYRKILLHIAYKPSDPLVVHCTAGKDRTGVICALILSLCGVKDEDVALEYALTEVGMPAEWREEVLQKLMKDPALVGNPAGARNMISARAENMIATLKMIREDFGGVAAYMTDKCGLTEKELDLIRSRLVDAQTPK